MFSITILKVYGTYAMRERANILLRPEHSAEPRFYIPLQDGQDFCVIAPPDIALSSPFAYTLLNSAYSIAGFLIIVNNIY
jgi:hypothetical protein